MALDSKKYTKGSETLFDILDAVADGLAAANEKPVGYVLKLDNSTKILCLTWNDSQNSVSLKADINADSCVIVVTGDGSWYTSMIGPLDTLFP